jgi:Zn-dependent metalloprotease
MGHAKTVDDLRLLSKSFGQQNGFRVTTNGNNKIKYVHGLLSEPNYQDVNSIQNFLEEYKTAFGLRSLDEELVLERIFRSPSGQSHFTFNQQYKGLPVLYRDLKVHTNRDGQISSISNQFSQNINLNPNPSFSVSTAIKVAKQHVNNRTYIKDNQLAVYTDDNGAFLVYKIDLAGIPVSKTVLVDAHSGVIIKEIMQTVNDGPTIGQGITNLGTVVDDLQIYEGNGFSGPNLLPDYMCESFCWEYGDCDGQSYDDCQLSFVQGNCDDGYIEDCVGDCWNDDHYFYWVWVLGDGVCHTNIQPDHPDADSVFYLVDHSAPELGHIYTLSTFSTNFTSGNWVASEDTLFDSEDPTTSERSGTEAHYYVRRSLDYYYDNHDYEGVDSAGARVGVVVDFTGFNAYYNQLFDVTSYGLGGVSAVWTTLPFSADPDIVGHEITHGITFHSSGLLYQNHSGALNESLSDMFGYLIEYDITGNTSWGLGTEIFLYPEGNSIRDISDPPLYGQPDRIFSGNYIGESSSPSQGNDYGGVHTNSGIPNKVFYLLIEGGNHYGWQVDPLDEDIDISRQMVAELMFIWNTQYLSATDNFWDAREKMLFVASDYFSDDPNIWLSVFSAWSSVGVHPQIEVSIPSGYFIPGIDTITVVADLSSYHDQLSSVNLSIMSSDSVITDTIGMTQESDELYYATYYLPEYEDLFYFSLHVEVVDDLIMDYDRMGQLVTAGPVEIHGFSFVGDPIVLPGATLAMSAELYNSGSSGIAPSISMEIGGYDTSCFSSVSNNSLFYGNLEPQQIIEQEAGFYVLTIDENCEMNYEPYMEMNIIVMGDLCWSDTISFVIGEQLNTSSYNIPGKFYLEYAYPNPFNPLTIIRYNLPEDAMVNITIYDMIGRQVKTLVNASQTAGYKTIHWNATNDKNRPVSAGLYLYAIQAGEFKQSKKMVLLK